jgi:hypothetical protein
MSTIDLATLREVIRFRGDYQNVRKFPNSFVNREIQKSFGEFYALVDSTHEGWWDTDSTVTTVADQAYIALPPQTWRVKAVDRLDGSDYLELRQIGLADRNKYDSSHSEPLAYRLSARGIELYPTPEQAYTLRVLYTPIAPALQEAQPPRVVQRVGRLRHRVNAHQARPPREGSARRPHRSAQGDRRSSEGRGERTPVSGARVPRAS